MPLKVYTVDTRDSHVPRAALAALGEKSHVQQAYIYVVAPTKKVAVERLRGTVNGSANQRNVRVAMGDSLDAIRAAGHLREDGQVLITSLDRERKVAAYHGPDDFQLIGELTRDIDSGAIRFIRQ